MGFSICGKEHAVEAVGLQGYTYIHMYVFT